MPIAVVNLLFLLAAALTGAAAIWWLCGRNDGSFAAPVPDSQAQQAAEVLARLQELATHVAVEVDEHSGRVEAINEELTATGGDEVAAIVQVVAKLVEANQHMQARLATTERKLCEQAQQLESHAIESRTDALTLLANRRAFDDEIARRLSEFQRHQRIFSLVMIDVDQFKRFNDTYGHQAGDEALRCIGRTLRRRMREMDVVARYGGEEFTIILPGTSLEEAQHVARRAREAVEKAHVQFDGQVLHVTASFGVVEVLPGENVSGLIKRADAALYASKDAGRNCIHWHDGKDVHVAEPDTRFQVGVKPPRDGQHGRVEEAAAIEPEAPHGTVLTEGDEAGHADFRPEPGTNLMTRSTFCQQVRARMSEWKRGGSSFSVVLAELDQYSQLVSQRDSSSGGQGLRAVADIMTATVREMDSVARYRPGCFALLLPRADLEGAGCVAERLHRTIATCALRLGTDALRLTLSIGVVEVAECDDDIVSLLKRAEIALDAAGHRGGDCSFHHDGDRCILASAVREKAGHFA